jgi:hypothetical protein
LEELLAVIPAAVRRQVSQQSSNLPFFISPRLRYASVAERTAAAIPVALGDRSEATQPERAAATALGESTSLGLGGLLDGPLVVAACLSFWGAGLKRLPWLTELRAERRPPPEMLALLRVRLALEFGRFI